MEHPDKYSNGCFYSTPEFMAANRMSPLLIVVYMMFAWYVYNKILLSHQGINKNVTGTKDHPHWT